MSTTSTWQVTGMTCGHCVASVEEELRELPGVESVEVTLDDGSVVLTTAEPVDRSAVQAAVEEAGYQLV